MHQPLHTYCQLYHLNKFMKQALLYSHFFPHDETETQETKFPQHYINIKKWR